MRTCVLLRALSLLVAPLVPACGGSTTPVGPGDDAGLDATGDDVANDGGIPPPGPVTKLDVLS